MSIYSSLVKQGMESSDAMEYSKIVLDESLSWEEQDVKIQPLIDRWLDKATKINHMEKENVN